MILVARPLEIKTKLHSGVTKCYGCVETFEQLVFFSKNYFSVKLCIASLRKVLDEHKNMV